MPFEAPLAKKQDMDSKNLKNSFICIQYPGQVKNVDNMIKSLGGIKQISEVNGCFPLFHSIVSNVFIFPSDV